MNVLRIVLSIIAGIIIGSLVNMGIVSISPHIIAPPAGIDTTTQEGLTEAIPLFQPKHFLFPFLAHAIGTFAGALIAARVCKTRKLMAALIVSGFFLIGGIINVTRSAL